MITRIAIYTIMVVLIFSGAVLSQSEGLKTEIIDVNRSDPETLAEIAGHLKSSDGKIMVDSRTNKIIIVDYPDNIRQIVDLIKHLDVPDKQVEIKVTIADVTDTFLNEAGIVSSGIIIPTGRFDAVMRLLDTDEKSNIRTQMTVTTMSNRPAKIQAVTEEVMGNSIIWYGHDKLVMAPLTVSAGDVLEVLPRVNNDGTILVTIRPSKSAFDEGSALSYSEQSVLTQVVIANGDTIALGGVEGAEEMAAEQRGSLFGMPLSRRDKGKTRKVVMFLTATLK